MTRTWPILALATALTAANAAAADGTTTTPLRSIERAAPDAVTQPAHLRGRLPQDTVAYARLPDPVAALSSPGGGGFDQALAAKPHTRAIEALRGNLPDVLDDALAPGRAALLTLLTQQLRSPLEVALIVPEDGGMAEQQTVLTGVLAIDDVAEANALLEQLVPQQGTATITQRFGPDQDARVRVGPATAQLRLRPETGRIMAVMGTAGDPAAALEDVMATLDPANESPVTAAETATNSGPGGLFAWADTERLSPMLTAQLPPQRRRAWERTGLDEARWLALSAGTEATAAGDSHRRSHLQLRIAGPRAGMRDLLPAPSNRFALEAAGDPNWLVSLALPDAETWTAVRERIENQSTADDDAYAAFADEVRSWLGVDPEALFAALGPEGMAFSDEAGQFAAVRIRDADAWETLAERLTEGDGHRRYRHGGQTYHEQAFPQGGLPDEAADAAPEWARRLAEAEDHWYWTRDGDYVVMAATPQALLTRSQMERGTDLATWLQDTQGQDLEPAVLAGTMGIEQGPRTVYRTYLQFLRYLGEVTGTPVNLFDMPTATEAGLPEAGAYGVQLNHGDDRLDVALTFEHSPADILAAAPTTAVVGAGVLAAVAVPAYEDYVERVEERLDSQTPPGREDTPPRDDPDGRADGKDGPRSNDGRRDKSTSK